MLVGHQDLDFSNAESAELECPRRTAREDPQLRWRLAAGHDQAALVPSLADCLQQPSIAATAIAIVSLAFAWLEQGLEVVENQQARSIPQQLKYGGQLVRLALGRHQLLV